MLTSKNYSLGFLLVFLMLYGLSIYQLNPYTTCSNSITLSTYDNLDSWLRIVKSGSELNSKFLEIIDNHTYVIGSIGASSYDIYLAKFDSSGEKIWEETWDGLDYDFIKGYVIDSENNIYIAGISSSHDSWGSYGNIFLLKYNINGNLLWSKTLDPFNSSYYHTHSIQIGLNDSIYISSTMYNSTSSMTFISKLSSNGDIYWSHIIEIAEYDGSYEVNLKFQIDSVGNIYLIQGDHLSNRTLLKLNASRSKQWEYDLGEDQSIGQLKIDFEDHIFLTGFDRDQKNSYIMKINKSGILTKKFVSDKGFGDNIWFMDDIYVLIETSLVEFNYDLDSIWNATIGNNATTEISGRVNFEITSNNTMFFFYDDIYSLTILRFNPSGTILSNFKWGESYYFSTKDTTIDSQDNLYMICTIYYTNLIDETNELTFLVKNPKNDAIATYLDQKIEDGEIFLFFLLAFSCIISIILLVRIFKPKYRPL